MHRLKLIASTITPVHVGNGDKLTPLFDFMCIKDPNSKSRWLVWKVHIDELIDFAEKNKIEKVLFSAAVERVKSLAEFLQANGLLRQFLGIIREKRKPVLAFDDIRFEVFEHENVEGKYLIPGTSLKGAVRTALVYHVFKKRKNEFGNIRIPTESKERQRVFKHYEKFIFGSEPKKDVFRGFVVSDSLKMRRAVFFLKLDRLHLVKGISRATAGAEVLDIKRAEFNVGWNFSEELWRLTDAKFKQDLRFLFDGDVKSLCRVINEFSLDFCDYELKRTSFFANYPEELKSFYESLRCEIESLPENAFVLRLGRFKTFMNQTVGMLESAVVGKLFGVTEVKKFPRTEWLAYYPRSGFKTVPLGWMRFQVEG